MVSGPPGKGDPKTGHGGINGTRRRRRVYSLGSPSEKTLSASR